MIDWLVAADDFTGALDTAVQLTKGGYEVLATIDADSDPGVCPDGVQALVVDTETRHLSSGESFPILFRLTERALRAGVPNILKKTDSALRGNVGGELEAVVRAAGGRSVVFAPAYPKMNRVTVGGVHYIDGLPVSESVFGRDPFEPVRLSSVSGIVRMQSSLEVRMINPGELTGNLSRNTVFAVNASTDEDLAVVARAIARQPAPRLAAGCAGLASQIGPAFAKHAPAAHKPVRTGTFVAISGSINPISLSQARYAAERGFLVYALRPEQKIADYHDPENRLRLRAELVRLFHEQRTGNILIAAATDENGTRETDALAAASGLRGEELRRRVSSAMGAAGAICLEMEPNAAYMLIGGDTFRAFMQMGGHRELRPMLELLPGVPLSLLAHGEHAVQIVSKSGGFGNERTLIEVAHQFTGRGSL